MKVSSQLYWQQRPVLCCGNCVKMRSAANICSDYSSAVCVIFCSVAGPSPVSPAVQFILRDKCLFITKINGVLCIGILNTGSSCQGRTLYSINSRICGSHFLDSSDTFDLFGCVMRIYFESMFCYKDIFHCDHPRPCLCLH